MYTLELYKSDKRTTKGERLLSRDDLPADGSTEQELISHYQELYPAPEYRIELHQTMVTKRNLINGKEFQERYDTPYYCSPSSETYWSM